MFFILSKLLSFFVSPFSWIFILLILALFLKKYRQKFVLISLVLSYLFSNSFLFDRIVNVYQTKATIFNTVPTSKCAVILGGMSTYDPTIDQINFGVGVDRLLYGHRLYLNNKIEKIIISGGSGSLLQDSFEADYLSKYLIEIGVKQKDILIDKQSKNTRENAIQTKILLKENKIKQPILLITSALHMPRALACFDQEGIQTIPISVDRLGGPIKPALDYFILPDATNFIKWYHLLHEMIGFITYKILGYA